MVTRTSRLEKLSRRFSRSARSCRLDGNWPVSHAGPAISWMKGLPSIASGSIPSAKAKRGETERTRRDVSICHSQSASPSSNSRRRSDTTSLFSAMAASATRVTRKLRAASIAPNEATAENIATRTAIEYWPLSMNEIADAVPTTQANSTVPSGMAGSRMGMTIISTAMADHAFSRVSPST